MPSVGIHVQMYVKQNRNTEGCSKLQRSVDMTSSGKNGLNIRTNASPKWDRTKMLGKTHKIQALTLKGLPISHHKVPEEPCGASRHGCRFDKVKD